MAITKYLPASINQTVTYVKNGFSCDTTETQYPLQMGVPIQIIYTFRVAPATTSNTCVAASNAWLGASTTYTLRTTAATSGTQIITAPITIDGVAGVELDCERSLSVTTAGTTTALATLTVTGYDYRRKALTFYYQLASGSVAGTYALSTPIAIVTGIFSDVNPGVNLSFGNAQNTAGTNYGTIGLPYYLPDLDSVMKCTWNGAAVDSDDIYPGTQWRVNPPTVENTFPSSNSDLDSSLARGAIILPSAPDGSKKLTVTYFVYGSDGEVNNQLQNRIQSTISIVDVQSNSSSEYVWPTLTTYDEVGMIYPGDLTAATEYDTLINA